MPSPVGDAARVVDGPVHVRVLHGPGEGLDIALIAGLLERLERAPGPHVQGSHWEVPEKGRGKWTAVSLFRNSLKLAGLPIKLAYFRGLIGISLREYYSVFGILKQLLYTLLTLYTVHNLVFYVLT